jgi:hypothetical protein
MQMMRMTVFNAYGNKIQGNLRKEPGEDKRADSQVVVGAAPGMRVVQLGQEMEHR